MKQLWLPLLLFVLLAIQVAVDLFNSVTISPFSHSGMYSDNFTRPDSMEVYELIVNGTTLNAGSYNIYTWDMIHAPLIAIDKQQTTNDFDPDKTAAKKALERIGLSNAASYISDNLDNPKDLSHSFPLWYKKYLDKLLRHPIRVLKINKNYYSYQNGKYLLLKKEEWINI